MTHLGYKILQKKHFYAVSKLQTGFVRNYALAVFTGVVVILGYLILFQ